MKFYLPKSQFLKNILKSSSLIILGLFSVTSAAEFDIQGNVQDFLGNTCINQSKGIELIYKNEKVSDSVIYEDSTESLKINAVGKFNLSTTTAKNIDLKEYNLRFDGNDYPLSNYSSSLIYTEGNFYLVGVKVLCDKNKIVEQRMQSLSTYTGGTGGVEDSESGNENLDKDALVQKVSIKITDEHGVDLTGATINFVNTQSNISDFKRNSIDSPFEAISSGNKILLLRKNVLYKVKVSKDGFQDLNDSFLPSSDTILYKARLIKIISNLNTENSNSGNETGSGINTKPEKNTDLDNINQETLSSSGQFDIKGKILDDKGNLVNMNGNITFINLKDPEVIYSEVVTGGEFELNNFQYVNRGTYSFKLISSKGVLLFEGQEDIASAKNIEIKLEKSLSTLLILIISIILGFILVVIFTKRKIILDRISNSFKNSTNNG